MLEFTHFFLPADLHPVRTADFGFERCGSHYRFADLKRLAPPDHIHTV